MAVATERRHQRGLKRRAKKWAAKVLLNIANWTVPYLYFAYVWFVYKTSKVEELGVNPGEMRARYGRSAWAVWHDEVFVVAYAFGRFSPHTIASRGDGGEVITRMLQLCGFVEVVRGGSSTSRTRRKTSALEEMVEGMQTRGCQLGITTDGSKGPRYRMKRGVTKVAIRAQVPLSIQAFWCRWSIKLPTWDRMLLPLPFNHIVHVYRNPWLPPARGSALEEQERFAKEVELELCRTKAYARRRVEGKPPPESWVEAFPEAHREVVREPGEPRLEMPDEGWEALEGAERLGP